MQVTQIDPSRTALLVVDVQNDFCANGMGEKIEQPLTTLLDAARDTRMLRVLIKANYDQDKILPRFAEQLESFGRLGAVCQSDTPGIDYWGPVQADAGDIEIVKHAYSAFRNTGLAATLHERNIDTVIVCGLTTQTCVDSTAREAFFEGFHAILATDACGDHGDTGDYFRRFDRLFGSATSVDAIVAALKVTA